MFRDFPLIFLKIYTFDCRLKFAWALARVLLRHAMVTGHTTVCLYYTIWRTRGSTIFLVSAPMRAIQRLKR